jgi:hypothetical protein
MSLASTDFAVVERLKTNFRIFCTHALGRDLSCRRPFTLRLLLRDVLSFPRVSFGGSDLRLFEIARVLVRVNHVARFIINADHGIM